MVVPTSRTRREADAAHLVDLMARTSGGQEEAFAELYDLTSSGIYGVVLQVLRSAEHAAKVTQDVYVEVWRQSARYTPAKGSVLGWATTMAHRRAVDRVRSVTSEPARAERVAADGSVREVDRLGDGVELEQDMERVRQAMASLSAIQREALNLAYFGGYTESGVASMLKLPLGTGKTGIGDALVGLRDALEVEA